MNITTCITGTIMQITGFIPCLATGYKVVDHYRKQIHTNMDTHVYLVEDGYRDIFRVHFHAVLDDSGEITKFVPIFAKRCRDE